MEASGGQAGGRRAWPERLVALGGLLWAIPYLNYLVRFIPPEEAVDQFVGVGYYLWCLLHLLLALGLLAAAIGRPRAAAGVLLAVIVAAVLDDAWRARVCGVIYRHMAVHQQRPDVLSDWFFRWRTPWLAAGLALVWLAAHLAWVTGVPRRARLRELELRVLLAAGSLLLAGGLVEGALRLGWVGVPWAVPSGGTEIFRLNPVLGYSHRPGLVTEHAGPEFRVTVRINRLGLRDRERSYPRRPGTARVLCLGDSFTFGAGVEAGQRFTDRLEATLPATEVINAGVIGYGTDQEYLYYVHEGWRFEPDLVVLAAYAPNDFYENTINGHLGYPKPVFVATSTGFEGRYLTTPGRWRVTDEPEPWTLWRASRAWGFAARTLHLVREQRRADAATRPTAPARPPAVSPAEPVSAAWLDDPRYAVRPVGYAVTEYLLRSLRDACAAHGSRLLVLLIAPPTCLAPPGERETEQRLADARSHRAFRDACRGLGLPVVDTLPVLSAHQARREPLYWPRDGHWTPLGHEVAAALLQPQIAALGR